jgi:hypothetical protein
MIQNDHVKEIPQSPDMQILTCENKKRCDCTSYNFIQSVPNHDTNKKLRIAD